MPDNDYVIQQARENNLNLRRITLLNTPPDDAAIDESWLLLARNLNGIKENYKYRLSDLVAKIDSYVDGRIETFDTTIQEMVASVTNKIEGIQQQLDDTYVTQDQLQERSSEIIDSFMARIDGVEAAIRTVLEQIVEIGNQLGVAFDSYDNMFVDIFTDINDIKATLTNHTNSLGNHETAISNISQNLSNIRSDINSHSLELNTHESQLNSHESILNSHEGILSSHEESISELYENVTKLMNEVTTNIEGIDNSRLDALEDIIQEIKENGYTPPTPPPESKPSIHYYLWFVDDANLSQIVSNGEITESAIANNLYTSQSINACPMTDELRYKVYDIISNKFYDGNNEFKENDLYMVIPENYIRIDGLDIYINGNNHLRSGMFDIPIIQVDNVRYKHTQENNLTGEDIYIYYRCIQVTENDINSGIALTY